MIYLVLRQPTVSGGYVNRFAFTDQRTSLAITCGGASISPAAQIVSVSEMHNALDISQAQGGLGQGIEFSASLADWDGAQRPSAAIFAGTDRFYGWSVAVARSDTETATPDWINDADHWMVTDCVIDGTSISLTVGERWANDGRLLAFGDNGAQVPLVVGGHDAWVTTSALAPAKPIGPLGTTGWYTGNPSDRAALVTKNTTATRKSDGGTYKAYWFQCAFDTLDPFYSEIAGLIFAGRIQIQGSTLTEIPTGDQKINYTLFQFGIVVSDSFYAIEDPKNVKLFDSLTGSLIAAGAATILGFSDGQNRSVMPKGSILVDSGLVSFFPQNATPDGFTAYTMQPCTPAFDPDVGDFGAYSNYTDAIITDGSPVRAWGDGNLRISRGETGGPNMSSWWMHFKLLAHDLDRFDSLGVAVDARTTHEVVNYDGSNGISFDCRTPYNSFTNSVRSTNKTVSFDVTPDPIGAFLPQKIFANLDAINSQDGFTTTLVFPATAFHCSVVFEIRAVTLYGITKLAFGSTSALVRTAAYPFPYAGYATNDRLDRAAITLLEQLAPYHGITISPAAPTYLPTAADGGECLDASKTYIENAIQLLKETWQVLGVTAYGSTPVDGQGLGEIPQPVSVVLGRFEDVITEPVVEFCDTAGTLTKKAYIANVDLEFDAGNPSKFYGGWGVAPAGAADPVGTEYGYLLWRICRDAWKVHRIKRGQTYQHRGIYDESVVGRMWWEASRNGARRIEWLCLQPRYLTYSVREAKPLAWAGSAVYIPGTLANFAGYDVTTWDNPGGDTLVVVDKSYDLLTGIGKYTVAIPPVPTVDAVAIYRDTIDGTATVDKWVDTIDATATIGRKIDTLEG